jgi:hypothetical protein
MNHITKQLNDVAELPSVLHEVREKLKYHTESGFTAEEANGYAQQLDEIEEILLPLWKERLQGADYQLAVDCTPQLAGFLKIKVMRVDEKPVEVFAESYGHFNSEMCDGSCYQYVYQKVLCYRDGLQTGRVAL